MSISIILKIAFTLTWFGLIEAIQLDRRSESRCGLMGTAIYCYGGLLTTGIDTNLYSLSLVDFPVNKSMINLAKGWNTVIPSNPDYALEPRRRSNAVVFNQNSLLISGGYTLNQTTLRNQTIVYHADSNAWETLSNYTDNQGRVSQIYNAAVASLVPNENNIVFYGGNTENPTFNDTAPIQTDSLNQTVMHIGFTSLTVFNFDTKQWLTRSPQTNTPTNVNYNAHTAVFNPRSSLIYYLGGFRSDSNDYTKENKMLFNTANTFDTKSGIWNTIRLNGKAPPARMYPTATMMPNSEDILLYGGTDTGTTSAYADFCYTLSLANNTWKSQTIDIRDVNSPPRFAHSAVLVNNSLFIMFGLAVYGTPLSDILVLDVKDVNNLYFPDTYPYIEREPKIIPTNDEPTINGSALSQGQVAGIAVACSAIGVGIIAAAIFFYIRKKKQNTKKLEEMSVDWDQVENFYTEQPAGNSTHFHENEKFVSMSTLTAPISPPARTVTSNPNEYDEDDYTKESSTVVSSPGGGIQERLMLVKPSAIPDNEQRTVNVSAQPPAIVKPDHGPQ